MKIVFLILMMFMFTIPSTLNALEPEEILSNPVFETRAREISKNIRCLVCQNQSIDDSNSDLAKDLRSIIRGKILSGSSNKEIYKFLVVRYGDFVLMKPPINKETFILWISPILFSLIGIFLIYYSLKTPYKKN